MALQFSSTKELGWGILAQDIFADSVQKLVKE